MQTHGVSEHARAHGLSPNRCSCVHLDLSLFAFLPSRNTDHRSSAGGSRVGGVGRRPCGRQASISLSATATSTCILARSRLPSACVRESQEKRRGRTPYKDPITRTPRNATLAIPCFHAPLRAGVVYAAGGSNVLQGQPGSVCRVNDLESAKRLREANTRVRAPITACIHDPWARRSQ